jgi:hypothetical protein
LAGFDPFMDMMAAIPATTHTQEGMEANKEGSDGAAGAGGVIGELPHGALPPDPQAAGPRGVEVMSGTAALVGTFIGISWGA